MEAKDFFEFLKDEIHTVVLATTDKKGNPVTCVMDIMLCDESGLYFITAKGKSVYERLCANKNVSLSGFKGSDTLSCTAVSVNGKAKEAGSDLLGEVFEQNKYMSEIYPNVESRQTLTVFKIYKGTGEYFDLSKKPVERFYFEFGGAESKNIVYFITEKCKSCGKCAKKCPTGCIEKGKPYIIIQKKCLHCGMCKKVCSHGAVKKRKI